MTRRLPLCTWTTAMAITGWWCTALSGQAAGPKANGRIGLSPTPAQAQAVARRGVDSAQSALPPPPANRHFKPLEKIDVWPQPEQGLLPPDYSADLFTPAREAPLAGRADRGWPEAVVSWAASELDHQPTYFDDVPLERNGQTCCRVLQPAISAGRFYGTFPAIPYKMAIDPPFQRLPVLGQWRPGSPAPCIHQTLPFDLHAGAWEGAAWAGLVLLLP